MANRLAADPQQVGLDELDVAGFLRSGHRNRLHEERRLKQRHDTNGPVPSFVLYIDFKVCACPAVILTFSLGVG